MTILKGKSPLLYDRAIDGHIGLNDVLLIHDNGVREKITRQEYKRHTAKELKNETISNLKELKHGGKSARRSVQRGRTSDAHGHREKHARHIKARKGLSVYPAGSSQESLPGVGGNGLAHKKSGITNRQ
jgi:hypothetical protein